ncbi:hypothetical protein DXG01_008406 [Tephrocybe rancida]|nr:hypothetical protein DXG01_008406 [Tephrocybe rancida]
MVEEVRIRQREDKEKASKREAEICWKDKEPRRAEATRMEERKDVRRKEAAAREEARRVREETWKKEQEMRHREEEFRKREEELRRRERDIVAQKKADMLKEEEDSRKEAEKLQKRFDEEAGQLEERKKLEVNSGQAKIENGMPPMVKDARIRQGEDEAQRRKEEVAKGEAEIHQKDKKSRRAMAARNEVEVATWKEEEVKEVEEARRKKKAKRGLAAREKARRALEEAWKKEQEMRYREEELRKREEKLRRHEREIAAPKEVDMLKEEDLQKEAEKLQKHFDEEAGQLKERNQFEANSHYEQQQEFRHQREEFKRREQEILERKRQDGGASYVSSMASPTRPHLPSPVASSTNGQTAHWSNASKSSRTASYKVTKQQFASTSEHHEREWATLADTNMKEQLLNQLLNQSTPEDPRASRKEEFETRLEEVIRREQVVEMREFETKQMKEEAMQTAEDIKRLKVEVITMGEELQRNEVDMKRREEDIRRNEEGARRKEEEVMLKTRYLEQQERDLKSRERATKAREGELELLLAKAQEAAVLFKLRSIFLDRTATQYKRLLKCVGADAQMLLDIFQSVRVVYSQRFQPLSYLEKLLDADGFPDRRQLIVAMQRLSAKTQLYPQRFLIDDPVYLIHDYPVDSGHFSDIYKADCQGSPTCLKVMRSHAASLVERMAKLNILVDASGRACLSDFGLSGVADDEIIKWATQSSAASKGGTLRWQAPELHDPDVDNIHNTKESDMFAWASTTYEAGPVRRPMRNTSIDLDVLQVFTGHPPFFEISSEYKVRVKIQRGDLPTRPPAADASWTKRGLTEGLWELLTSCWKREPSERPDISAVKSRLDAEKPAEDPRPAGQRGPGFAMRFRNALEASVQERRPSLEDLDVVLSRVMDDSRESDASKDGVEEAMHVWCENQLNKLRCYKYTHQTLQAVKGAEQPDRKRRV